MYKLGLKSLIDPRREEFPKFLVDPTLVAHLSAKVDYSYLYPSVDNQGNIGDCTAFGTAKVFEFFYRKCHYVTSYSYMFCLLTVLLDQYDRNKLLEFI